jgi:hypothetical protein
LVTYIFFEYCGSRYSKTEIDDTLPAQPVGSGFGMTILPYATADPVTPLVAIRLPSKLRSPKLTVE